MMNELIACSIRIPFPFIYLFSVHYNHKIREKQMHFLTFFRIKKFFPICDTTYRNPILYEILDIVKYFFKKNLQYHSVEWDLHNFPIYSLLSLPSESKATA